MAYRIPSNNNISSRKTKEQQYAIIHTKAIHAYYTNSNKNTKSFKKGLSAGGIRLTIFLEMFGDDGKYIYSLKDSSLKGYVYPDKRTRKMSIVLYMDTISLNFTLPLIKAKLSRDEDLPFSSLEQDDKLLETIWSLIDLAYAKDDTIINEDNTRISSMKEHQAYGLAEAPQTDIDVNMTGNIVVKTITKLDTTGTEKVRTEMKLMEINYKEIIKGKDSTIERLKAEIQRLKSGDATEQNQLEIVDAIVEDVQVQGIIIEEESSELLNIFADCVDSQVDEVDEDDDDMEFDELS